MNQVLPSIPGYAALLNDLRANDAIVGVVLAGSHAKGLQNDDSDVDLYLIVTDTTNDNMITKIKDYYDETFYELRVDLSNKAIQRISDFYDYARMGSPYVWDRYNLVHTNIEVDKTDGQLAECMQRKAMLSPDERDYIIESHLGDFVNLSYRTVWSVLKEKELAARLDASELLTHALHIMFALEHRVRPYNKYLEWELETYPFAQKGWSLEEVTVLITAIQAADRHALRRLYAQIETMTRAIGFDATYDAWGDKLRSISHDTL